MSTNTIIKRFLFVLLLFVGGFTAGTVKAQSEYGNEWINYSQTYYKIKVANNGLHRLSYNYLQSLGLTDVNPQHFQLFRRGKEVSIYVAGEQDGRLDAQDYMEFYGERNDGYFDRDLYKNPAHQMHQLHSFYTDTAAYFLTVSAAGGKRMRGENPAVNGQAPEPYHLQKVTHTQPERYYYGRLNDLAQMSWIHEGEGYFSHGSVNPKSYTIGTLTNVVTTGPKPRMEYGIGSLKVIADNNSPNNVNINVVPNSGTPRQVGQHTVVATSAAKGVAELEFSDIRTNGSVMFQTAPVANSSGAINITFSFSRITFPQRSEFSGSSMFFYTDSTRSATPYYEFTNAPASVVAYDVTDQGNIVRIEGHMNGTSKGFVVQGNTVTRKLLLANTSNFFEPVGRAYRVNFRNIQADAHNYIILTNKRLMKKVGSAALTAPAEYAVYRASEQGGGYDTLLVHIDQVVDQFHYGEFSVNSIRRMMKFMMASTRPKQLFIIGKGARYTSDEYHHSLYPGKYGYYHIGARLPNVYEFDLVPSGIAPVSDVLLTADFHNSMYEPQVPTGRLAAMRPEEVMNYLNKIKEYEAVPEGLPWRKNILQLGGGKNQQEILRMSSFLRGYKRIAEGPLLGANVIERYRQNLSEVVETINVTNEVNAGLSLITFFGHSSPGSTDLDIGFVSGALSGYRNKGKYPIMLMLGCGTGEAFLPNNISFGEDWLNTADRGAVALIAHAQAGYETFLNLYASNFYTVAFQDPAFYGKTLGEIQKETIRRVNRTTSNEIAIAMVMQMILQGDPALKPYAPSKPDYLVESGEFRVETADGSLPTSGVDEFTISFNVNNLGKVLTDPFNVSVKRTLADNSVIISEHIINPIIRRERLQLTLDNREVAAEGVNNFEIFLDHTNLIDELNEENNIGHFQYFMPASGLLALNPVEYGIVNNQKVNLLVQATQVNNTRNSYYFELDTTQLFNSNLKQTKTITADVLPNWEVTLPNLGAKSDNAVFYWRSRFEEQAEGEEVLWAGGSFRHIENGQYGWSQSHYGQFDKAQTTDIHRLDQPALAWEFDPLTTTIDIRTVGGDVQFTSDSYGLFVNGARELSAGCSNPFGSTTARMFFIVFDNITLEKVTTIPGFTGCTATPYLFEFGNMNNATNRANMERFLNAVPAGYHVAAISVNKVPFESFTPELKAAFTNIGSGLVDNLKNNYPFAIVGTKGAAAGTANEVTATVEPQTAQPVVLTTQLQTRKPSGTITSSVIGPAQSWGNLFHEIATPDAGDAYTLSVIGIKADGGQQVLADDVKDVNFSLSHIDATEYPNLQLSVLLSDPAARTAPQLKQWMVTYIDNTPEGIIRPDLVRVNEEILTDQARRGSITIPMAFQNISDFDFSDSLVVEVTLTGEGLQEPQVSQFKIGAVKADSIEYFSYTLNTATLTGNYRVMMFVNPHRLQREKFYTNNVFEVPFRVNPRLHPTMDIAFDGIHIMDGELVSPSPMISIVVRDEARGAYLQDPSSMSVVMLNENGVETEVDLMNNGEVRVFPADDKNDFRVEYQPAPLETGKYTLVVSARDVNGAATGMVPYRINFEVVKEAGITNFYPFPNPFSTKTNFIFTLTGSTVPSDFKVQILTVTGKVVKEILKDELGPIKIGNNKTEYAWDGTDTYGDKLANGVYLYRVVMPQSEEEMKHRASGGDKSFKNGYGKLYILR